MVRSKDDWLERCRHASGHRNNGGCTGRLPMIAPLKEAMDRDDDILVISHSLGSMIAYDTLWKFCRTGEYRPNYTGKKISLWITLGSPLGDETVKRHLNGANATGDRRYPNNLTNWVNVAAEDDYICHDRRSPTITPR